MPIALRVAKFSSREVSSAGRVALFRSDQARDMMPQLVISWIRMGLGWWVSKSTVFASTARTSFTVASTEPTLDPGARTRWTLKTTSSEVKGVPSEKRTPRRRWKRQTVGETCSQRSASAGSGCIWAFRRTSGS